MMKAENPGGPAKYRVGERVQFGHRGRRVWGTILEDRGPIGMNGRRLYRISVARDPHEPEDHVRAEEELEPDSLSRVPLSKSEIIDFFKGIVLLDILLASTAEAIIRPVWLCRGPRGEVAYTFSSNRGQIGGRPVPVSAVRLGMWIDERKKDEVAAFLLGFGLSPDEAMDVIDAVGVLPPKKDRDR